jgi:hypothetical protein
VACICGKQPDGTLHAGSAAPIGRSVKSPVASETLLWLSMVDLCPIDSQEAHGICCLDGTFFFQPRPTDLKEIAKTLFDTQRRMTAQEGVSGHPRENDEAVLAQARVQYVQASKAGDLGRLFSM